MNWQFPRFVVSFFVWIVFVGLMFFSVGCDLGTYNKRFKERNAPAAAKPVKKDADKQPVEDADADDASRAEEAARAADSRR